MLLVLVWRYTYDVIRAIYATFIFRLKIFITYVNDVHVMSHIIDTRKERFEMEYLKI